MPMIEIERKFLVRSNDFKQRSDRNYKIVQGFLNRDPERTIRIRINNEKGILTIKGLSSKDGLKRFEWETEIELIEAHSLLELCEEHLIEKERYEIKIEDFVFEVDEFFGANEGLIIAEIELEHEDQEFPKPDWLGEEVTGDIKYYNSQLSLNPYDQWED